jgi:hypothetical protein
MNKCIRNSSKSNKKGKSAQSRYLAGLSPRATTIKTQSKPTVTAPQWVESNDHHLDVRGEPDER